MMNFATLGIVINPHGPAEQRVRCPWCEGRQTDTLGVNVETGQFHCFRCGRKNGDGVDITRSRIVQLLDDPALTERKRERLRTIWRESVPLNGEGLIGLGSLPDEDSPQTIRFVHEER